MLQKLLGSLPHLSKEKVLVFTLEFHIHSDWTGLDQSLQVGEKEYSGGLSTLLVILLLEGYR